MNLTPRQTDVIVAIRNYRHIHGRDRHKAQTLDIISEDLLPDESRATKLPLLGNIAAGSPIEAVENREEIDLETLFHSKHGVYVLRIRGESMIDDHLCDGDYVVIERRESARAGEQIVALIDGQE